MSNPPMTSFGHIAVSHEPATLQDASVAYAEHHAALRCSLLDGHRVDLLALRPPSLELSFVANIQLLLAQEPRP